MNLEAESSAKPQTPRSTILSEVEGSIPYFYRCVFIAVLALVLIACSKLTADNLQKVHNGMTTAEVKQILGEPTNVKTGNLLGIVSGTTYIYHTPNSDVEINFVDDKVISTSGEFK